MIAKMSRWLVHWVGTRDGISVYQYIEYIGLSALFEISVVGIGKSQDQYNIGYLLSALAKYWL